MAVLTAIADAVWTAPTRTLAGGSAAAPVNGAQRVAVGVWTYGTRRLSGPTLAVSGTGLSGTTLALGTVNQGGTYSRSLTLANHGGQPLVLGTIAPGTGLTLTADPSGQTVAPGGSATLTLAVDTATPGGFSRALSIPSNDATSPYVLTVTGTVNARPTVTAASVNAAGNALSLTYSESVAGVVAADYALSGHTLGTPTGSGTGRVFPVSSPVGDAESLTLAYAGTGTVDGGGAGLAAFGGLLVTNHSTVDLTPPDAMSGLTASPFNRTVTLAWNATVDADRSIIRVYRDGVLVATLAGTATTYGDGGLVGGQTYAYQISAVDAAGNESARTAAVTATPPYYPPVVLTYNPYPLAPTAVSLTVLTAGGQPVDGVALPAAFAPTGGGEWVYSFLPPAPVLPYDAWQGVATIGGQPVAVSGTVRDGAGAGISAFTPRDAVDAFGGPQNVRAYASKNGTYTDDASVSAAYLQAGRDTDADIRNAWQSLLINRNGNQDVTLESLLSAYPDEARKLAKLANRGIVLSLYEGRGTQDSGNGSSGGDDDVLRIDGKMAGLRKQYNQGLSAIAGGTYLWSMQKAAGVVGILEAQAGLAPTAGSADPGDGARYASGRENWWC